MIHYTIHTIIYNIHTINI